MSNKRELKKQIRYICGDVAAECIMTKALIDNVDKKALEDCVVKVAELQTTALARANVSFDKTPKSFPSVKEYRKARREYFAKAYKSISEGFNNQLAAIVKEMNAALPKTKKD